MIEFSRMLWNESNSQYEEMYYSIDEATGEGTITVYDVMFWFHSFETMRIDFADCALQSMLDDYDGKNGYEFFKEVEVWSCLYADVARCIEEDTSSCDTLDEFLKGRKCSKNDDYYLEEIMDDITRIIRYSDDRQNPMVCAKVIIEAASQKYNLNYESYYNEVMDRVKLIEDK